MVMHKWCEIFELNTHKDEEHKFVVVLSNYKGKFLLSRHKDRDTWETQGGHIEKGESIIDAAKRELFEESGAVDFNIKPICEYAAGDDNGSASGVVFFAEISALGDIPESEMTEVKVFDTLPENFTYPKITPKLFERAIKMGLF